VAGPDPTVAGHVRSLVTAARERRVVTIDYTSASSGRASRRGLEPYGIVQHGGAWYVVGRCRKQGDTRTFRVDRIVALEASPTGETFAAPEGFDLEAYRRERIFVPGADAITCRVRLDAIGVARVGAAWPAGRVSRLSDGGAEIELECDGLEWVVGWTLGHGAHAEIVSPVEAREALLSRVEAMKQQHRQSPGSSK
jgi:predicted DNA-binding transcriptional regulator YafY